MICVNNKEDFISLYLSYTSKTECPTFFHRWCGLTALAAWIGRDIYFPFGPFRIHANMYVMLVGLAGTKKSTAIKMSAGVLKQAGYNKFAARKTRQEKFLIDLADGMDNLDDVIGMVDSDILDANLFGSGTSASDKPPAEVFVAADEANNFIGVNNLDFMGILGDLWDYEGVFDYRLKNSNSVYINEPHINMLLGNTFVGFSKLFPPEAIEQGFFSRILFIYAEPKGRQYCIMPETDGEVLEKLIAKLAEIKSKVKGKVEITPEAYKLLDKVYLSWKGMNDPRFDAYENRRIIHLLKLAMLVMATRLDKTIQVADIIEANTVLTYTEHLMPKALGEFGRSRNSSVTHKIMEFIDKADKPVTVQGIWKVIHNDLDNRNQLLEILGNLQVAEKIQAIAGNGYLPVRKVREEGLEGAVDLSLLTDEERDLV